MSRTRHFQKRINWKRGITLDLVEMARAFGVPEQDKMILGKKQLGMLINAARDLQKTAGTEGVGQGRHRCCGSGWSLDHNLRCRQL